MSYYDKEDHFDDKEDGIEYDDEEDVIDDLLVEEEVPYDTKDLADGVVDILDSDVMNWDNGVYETFENAVEALIDSGLIDDMSDDDYDTWISNGDSSVIRDYIEKHPTQAEDIFNTVAKVFGYQNYGDYRSYIDWVESGGEDEMIRDLNDSIKQNEEDMIARANADDKIYNSSLLKDLYGDDWNEEEEVTEATNCGAIANVPGKHKRIDLDETEYLTDEEELDESYKRIDYEDDVVIVYDPDGKEIYKGIEDYEPMKDEYWKWDSSENCYKLDGYKKYCLDV